MKNDARKNACIVSFVGPVPCPFHFLEGSSNQRLFARSQNYGKYPSGLPTCHGSLPGQSFSGPKPGFDLHCRRFSAGGQSSAQFSPVSAPPWPFAASALILQRSLYEAGTLPRNTAWHGSAPPQIKCITRKEESIPNSTPTTPDRTARISRPCSRPPVPIVVCC